MIHKNSPFCSQNEFCGVSNIKFVIILVLTYIFVQKIVIFYSKSGNLMSQFVFLLENTVDSKVRVQLSASPVYHLI
jgi:hypothetical protein